MRVVILLMLILSVGRADARTKAGVTLSDEITVSGKRLQLNGMGVREATALKVDVYVAGLYVEHPSSDPVRLLAASEPKVLVLRFVRGVDREDMVKAWLKGFEGADVSRAQVDQLVSWMTDVKKGQILAFTYVPGAGVTVDLDGVRKGTIADEGFARALFSVWLGPNPPNSGLKKGLLGG